MFQLTNISLTIFIAAAVNIFTAYIAWQRRNTKGGIYFAAALIAIALWSVASGLDYAAVPITLKVFFAKIEYVGYLSALALMTTYFIIYAGHEDWLHRISVRVLLGFVPVFGILLAWTNELHHLIWTDFIPGPQGNNVVDFVHGPAFYAMSIGGYLLIISMVLNLLQVAVTATGLVRRQAILMLGALFIPVASNLLYQFQILYIPGVDWSDITFSITGLLLIIALYGSRFMEIVPTARNVMVDEMGDAVLVIDDQGRLVDFNPSAQDIFGVSQSDLWNPVHASNLTRIPEIATLIADPSSKLARDVDIGDRSYAIQRTPLLSNRNALYGQLLVIHDISEQKMVLRQLQRREEEFRLLITTAADAIILVDTKGKIVLANEQAVNLLGYEQEELLGLNVDSLVPMRVRELHSHHRAEYAANPHPRPMRSASEIIARHKSGHEIPVDISLSYLNTSEGMLISAAIRDITHRIQVEETLRNRTSILTTLQQTMLDLVDHHDVDEILQTLLLRIGHLLNAHHVSIDLLEEPDTLVTQAVTPGQPLQKGDRMKHGEGGWLSWQAIETGQPAIMEDYSSWSDRRGLYEGFPIRAIAIIPIHQRDRVIGTINFSREDLGKPFNDTEIYAAQQLAQMVALVLDNAQLYTQLQHELVERKQIEEVLRISQENFISYFNMGTVGMCVTTPEKDWIEVNDQLCRMLGYSKEELKQYTWSQFTHPDDLDIDLELFDQTMRGERDSYQLEKRFIRRDGGILYVSLFVTCQRFPDGSPRYFLASLVDISARVEQEAELRATEAQLAEQRRSMAVIEERQRLARDLHDSVSQSLHSLNLFSETLTSSLGKANKERTLQLAERLQESARQALKEARLMLYQLQPSELEAEVDLVHEIEARLSMVEERAGVRTAVKVEGNVNLCPPTWREDLFRITIEALNNSLKHAQAHNVTITLRCDASKMDLKVTDDGIGFDPSRARTGGMGMRTMHERADLLGGILEVHSSLGSGTSVIVHVEKKETP